MSKNINYKLFISSPLDKFNFENLHKINICSFWLVLIVQTSVDVDTVKE